MTAVDLAHLPAVPPPAARRHHRALGLDPGETTGWGLIEGGVRERVIAFGVLDQEGPCAHFRELVHEYRPELVAVEIVERVHPVRRSGVTGISTVQALHLYRAGLLAGRLIASAEGLGVDVVLFTAERWRGGAVGSETANDADIERALCLRIADFPAPRRSNAHERDGMGIALYAILDARLRAGRTT